MVSPFSRFGSIPEKSGLYNPADEKDSCGFAMVATTRGYAGHDIIDTALSSLRNLEHRGAVGSDAGTGDGAGILIQVPDAFFRAVLGFDLPRQVPTLSESRSCPLTIRNVRPKKPA